MCVVDWTDRRASVGCMGQAGNIEARRGIVVGRSTPLGRLGRDVTDPARCSVCRPTPPPCLGACISMMRRLRRPPLASCSALRRAMAVAAPHCFCTSCCCCCRCDCLCCPYQLTFVRLSSGRSHSALSM